MARLRSTATEDDYGTAGTNRDPYASPTSTAQDYGQTPPAGAEPGGYAGTYEDGGITGKTSNPGASAQTAWGNYAGQLGGFDAAKTNKVDPKYVFAKYASNYDVGNRSNDAKLLADLRNDPSGYFKNASWDGDILHGAYDPETGKYGDVDAIKGYDAGGQGWQWGAIDSSVGKTSPGMSPYPGSGSGMGAPSGGSGGGGGYTAPSSSQLMDILKGLFPNGAFNKDLVNARVSNASDILNRNRKSQLANNEALLAARGQGRNDGTFGTSAGNLEERLGQDFNSSVNDAYATESGNADNRMIQALQMATGITENDAKNAVDMARINSDDKLGWGNIGLGYTNAGINEKLGLGNLALGNSKNSNDYNLALGQLGLGRDTLLQNGKNANYDFLIRLLDSGVSLDQLIAQGYI